MEWTDFGSTLKDARVTEETITLLTQKIDFTLAPVVPTEKWYWHDRQRAAQGAGRTLFVIFEDTWELRQDAVKNFIQRRASGGDRLNARDLEIGFCRNSDAFPFYEKFHVQGRPASGEHWCLFADGEIKAAMTFRTASSLRGMRSKEVIELTRFATSCDITGAASRLHTAFLRANPDTRHIVSYADKSMFTGDMYLSLGYTKTRDIPSAYWIIENGIRNHQARYQKSVLKKRFGEWICRGRTEKEICSLFGLHRLYDCGKIRFDLHLDS